jgi:hypothetical protein
MLERRLNSCRQSSVPQFLSEYITGKSVLYTSSSKPLQKHVLNFLICSAEILRMNEPVFRMTTSTQFTALATSVWVSVCLNCTLLDGVVGCLFRVVHVGTRPEHLPEMSVSTIPF